MSDAPPRKPHYFDRRPSDAITAEAIRQHVFSDREALRALLAHPGVSSSARSVIEAQLEREATESALEPRGTKP